MLRLIVAAALALTAGAPVAASAQADADFALIRDWTPIGTVDSEAVADTLLLKAGTIQSYDVHRDVVFRFEYRLPSAAARAALLLRAGTAGDGSAREYAVALDGTGGSGQLSAVGLTLHEGRFRPQTAPRRDWTPCEVRMEGGRLTVAIDGTVVAEADGLEAREGRLGFRAIREGVELRGMRVARPPGSTSAFRPDLPAANSPGITPPRLRKQVGPVYPEQARRQRISGTVLLAIEITPDGRVGDMHIARSPHPDLIEPSLVCVRQWRFDPARKDGVPVAVTATVEVAFNLTR